MMDGLLTPFAFLFAATVAATALLTGLGWTLAQAGRWLLVRYRSRRAFWRAIRSRPPTPPGRLAVSRLPAG